MSTVNTRGLESAVNAACAEMDRLRGINEELLEACEAMRRLMQDWRFSGKPDLGEILKWMDKSDDAIRKAKGEVTA